MGDWTANPDRRRYGCTDGIRNDQLYGLRARGILNHQLKMPQGQLSGVRYVIEERICKNNPNHSNVVGIFSYYDVTFP